MYLPHLQCHAAARFSAHLDAFMVRGVDKRFGVANIILQNDARVSKQKKRQIRASLGTLYSYEHYLRHPLPSVLSAECEILASRLKSLKMFLKVLGTCSGC